MKYQLNSTRAVVNLLAGRAVFAGLVVLGVLFIGYLVWTRASILRQAGGLPAGITAEAPRLDTNATQEVATQRSERTNHVISSYDQFSASFVANGR